MSAARKSKPSAWLVPPGYEAQVRAFGATAMPLVNIVTSLADGTSKFVPDTLVGSGSNGGGALDGLAAAAMRYLAGNGGGAGTKSAAPKTRLVAGGTTPASPSKSSQD